MPIVYLLCTVLSLQGIWIPLTLAVAITFTLYSVALSLQYPLHFYLKREKMKKKKNESSSHWLRIFSGCLLKGSRQSFPLTLANLPKYNSHFSCKQSQLFISCIVISEVFSFYHQNLLCSSYYFHYLYSTDHPKILSGAWNKISLISSSNFCWKRRSYWHKIGQFHNGWKTMQFTTDFSC